MTKISAKIIYLFIVFSSIAFSQLNSFPGAFSRMGFDAKGISMGNSISAVIDDIYSTYYNPAQSVFQENFTFNASYSFLDLDRYLNTLSFTKQVKMKQKNSDDFIYAGISFGLINAGVKNIDERDIDGALQGTISTFENQFFFSIAAKFNPKLSMGATFKFYYSKLYDKVTSSGFGVDLGLLYLISKSLSLSAVIKEINSKYEWDTNELYGQDGNKTIDRFPLLKKVGLAYRQNDDLIFSIEYENSIQGTNILKFGSEYKIIEYLSLRCGIDRFDLSNTDNGIKSSIGFGINKEFDSITPIINYAFVLEPFTHSPIQILSLTLKF